MKRVRLALASVVLVASVSIISGYTKPNTYRPSTNAIVFKDQYLNSPHSWVIVKAIQLLRADGYQTEANVAEKYLLPMLEGVTFNDVWGDADMAGASVLDYYVPSSPETNYGFGSAAFAYKNDTSTYKSHPLYGYENAAEHAQYRYDYGKRVYRGEWGDGTDGRDTMAGWVVDTHFGQDDPQDGRWANGTVQLDAESRFGAGQTPATALLDLLQDHTDTQVVFPAQTDPLLSTIYVPKKEVFDQAPEWLDEHFGDADDIEAYMGYDGHGYAVYANWTLDAGGHCNGGADCAAPMVVRLPVHSKAHAFFQLGWAIHLLEDNTTPVHTINSSYTTYQVHNDVETEADAVLIDPVTVTAGVVKSLLPALNAPAFNVLYDWPPPSCTGDALNPADYYKARWYADSLASPDEGVAHAYTRQAAVIAHGFMPYITCIDTERDRNWASMGFFTALGLDNAIKITAGLIRQFIEDVDRTPPAVTIVRPAATNYPHTATLTLNYSATDDESGVKSVTATLDGNATLNGHGLASGQAINLLTEGLTLGNHTLTVKAVDNAGNVASPSVTFTIVVTPDSIKGDVAQFLAAGAIDNAGIANSLLKKLNAAAKARAAGDCTAAGNIYQAFINELQAQSGKHVDAAAAGVMIADAQYLIAHCP